MKRIDVNGVSFLTAKAGSGPRLLFLGGTGFDLRNSGSALESPLINEFEVLMYDQRGLGQSDKPPKLPTPYTMADYANDAAAVMDAYGWQRAHVVGYSFGGMVAQEFAIRYPERVSRLVLGATAAGGRGGASFPLQTLYDLPAPERARRSMEIADLTFTPEWQAAHPELAAERIAARVVKQEKFAHEPGHRDGQIAQLEARSHHDTYDRLGQITAPTLVLAGTIDGQAPMAAGKALAERIADCTFQTVEGTHQMLQENPAVYGHIAQFLRAAA
jgi:3-oxoadipate enol-lactonase